jgi:hypothetical protein
MAQRQRAQPDGALLSGLERGAIARCADVGLRTGDQRGEVLRGGGAVERGASR